jgi:tyrosinase
MAVTRRNIVKNASSRTNYINGVKLLKEENSGRTTADFGIAGPSSPVSTYDLFVIWHQLTMMTLTPPPPASNSAGRNAAHRGPIFLPWHRVMLMLLEQNLQRVLNDATFGLLYWDWAADGDKAIAKQKSAAVWGTKCMGGTALPRSQHVTNALQLTPYDASPWDSTAVGFRNRTEGWSDKGQSEPWLHKRVHVWVGGDMSPGTSPNDPVFFLNHCNEDRIWESWMTKNGRVYLPSMSAGAALAGHRIDDPIASPLGGSTTPRDVLDVSSTYVYDKLA